jgi:hypothetical protein
VWINGGRELAYVNDQRKLVAVEMRSSGMQIDVSQARMLFGGQPLPVLPGLQPGDFSLARCICPRRGTGRTRSTYQFLFGKA